MASGEAGETISPAYSDRRCPAEETFRRVEPLLSGYGITRLARLTDLDNLGIPVWNAVAPNARSIVINQGKGITDGDAKVSAAMEALERAVAGNPDIGKRTTSWQTLANAGTAADRLPGLIAAGKDDIGPDELLAWVAGVDLMTGGVIHVPFGAVVLDRTQGESRYWQSSDGLASGNDFDEAALHGLLERIERDAYVLWQIKGQQGQWASCIEPGSFDDAVIADLTGRIAAARLSLRLFDISSDIGIPCYSALLAPAEILTMQRPRYLDVTHGSGAHPSPVRAAIRAITEAAQSRLTFISGARDDIHPDRFTQALPRDTRLCFEATPHRMPIELPRQMPGGAAALLVHTLDRLRRAGIDRVIAVRLTAENTPFSVAKILVPQLENPEGSRKRKFGLRAISSALQML